MLSLITSHHIHRLATTPNDRIGVLGIDTTPTKSDKFGVLTNCSAVLDDDDNLFTPIDEGFCGLELSYDPSVHHTCQRHS